MADTITLPFGIGAQPKKTVFIAVGGVALLGGVAYYRRKKAAAATPATTTPDQIDPATGFAYGSPEEAAALSQQANYQAPPPLDFSGGAAITPGGVNISQTFSDNASWERACIDYLTNTVGLSVGSVSSALSKYIAGQAVTPAEQAIIHQAIAAEGQAPVAGSNGYPPSIRQAPTAGTPATVGKPAAPKLSLISTSKTEAGLRWSAVPGATKYHVRRNDGGFKDMTGTTVTVPRPGHYTVQAINSAGASALSNVITV